MKAGLVAVHYPRRREHWDEMISRVHRAAGVLAATPGVPGTSTSRTITSIVPTGPGTCSHRPASASSQPRSPTWRRRGYDVTRSSAG